MCNRCRRVVNEVNGWNQNSTQEKVTVSFVERVVSETYSFAFEYGRCGRCLRVVYEVNGWNAMYACVMYCVIVFGCPCYGRSRSCVDRTSRGFRFDTRDGCETGG